MYAGRECKRRRRERATGGLVERQTVSPRPSKKAATKLDLRYGEVTTEKFLRVLANKRKVVYAANGPT